MTNHYIALKHPSPEFIDLRRLAVHRWADGLELVETWKEERSVRAVPSEDHGAELIARRVAELTAAGWTVCV